MMQSACGDEQKSGLLLPLRYPDIFLKQFWFADNQSVPPHEVVYNMSAQSSGRSCRARCSAERHQQCHEGLSMLDSLAKLLPFSDILSNVLTFMVLVGISWDHSGVLKQAPPLLVELAIALQIDKKWTPSL
jgi:hypothetical protein